tara:strand:+ start:974 stop:1453 length:480 start_codon:yes stop_codon:yes gene_type:complete
MNALKDIKKQAEVIVDDLASREINRIEGNSIAFETYLTANPDFIIYSDWSGDKQIGKTVRKYNSETSGSIDLYEYFMTQRKNWKENFTVEFKGANMMKLNRALAKHISDDMTASDIKVNIAGDGAEVRANVDDKYFRTFATICGGYIQCLHYRYRSSLK